MQYRRLRRRGKPRLARPHPTTPEAGPSSLQDKTTSDKTTSFTEQLTWPRFWVDRFPSRPELPLVAAAFLIYLIFQLHAVAFHGYWGQDFDRHKSWISQAAYDPWTFIGTYRAGRTNPPLYHVLAGLVHRAVGLPNYIPAIGLMNVMFGIAAMAALYALVCRLIRSAVLRLAAIVFLLFLPFAMIHAEVIAADALATPLFLIFVWMAVSLPGMISRRSFGISVAAGSFCLLAGVYTKFTFDSVIAGAALWLALLWWTRMLPVRRLAVAFVALVVLPALLAYAEMHRYMSQQTYNLGIRPRLSLSGVMNAEMNPRSILFLRRADVDVLAAPSYDWTVNGSVELLVNNKHSFLALLHLAMFSDVLNIYQYDPYDSYFGIRTTRNHARMQAAVRFGIAFSLLAFIGVVVLFFRSAIGSLIRRRTASIPVLTLLLFSMAWFLNIVALLPAVADSYLGGYWLPRLIVPALLGFFLAGFVFLDGLKWTSRSVKIALLLIVIAQSSLHASFLWPNRSTEPLYEPNEDLIHTKFPTIIRLFNWQPWLGKAIGVVIYRRAPQTGLEKWQLSFSAAPGPGNPAPHRRIRISCRYCEPKTVEFDKATRIVVDVMIASGRNDILIETVEPEQVVETPGDASVPLVRVAEVVFARSGESAIWDFSPIRPRGLVASVSPHSSTQRKQTFTVVASDRLGYADIDYVYFLVNDTRTIPRYTCHGSYQVGTGVLRLYGDTSPARRFVEGVAGSGPPLNNGLCALDPATTSAKGSGSHLTVNFALYLDPSYNNKNVYFWVKDSDGHDTGWVDTGTTWNPASGK